ncbi:hypothetical protein [Nitrospirillum pindoramense]|uniref:Uncharacterized protein n=1 Tax=Nitrospirillum amazonense TaxID=28077 RepID=A0A560HH89_9PROT|nr:hypothetical protein [Nitrospirillum amazonense]TWB45828.1 hypothetical protein FBZ90_101163 [Nitrospirillum amazonense]
MDKPKQTLITTGTSYDGSVILGLRPSGLLVGKSAYEESKKVFLVPPRAMAFAPILWEEATKLGFHISESADSRFYVRGNLAELVDRFDALIIAGDRGGIREGDHTDAYNVTHSRSEWGYNVTPSWAAGASIKSIGKYAGNGRFLVPFEKSEQLTARIKRAVTAEKKAQAGAINLPEVPGLPVQVVGSEIRIPWPGSDEAAAILRAVRGMRWDDGDSVDDAGYFAILSHHANSVSKALTKVAALRAEIASHTIDLPEYPLLKISVVNGEVRVAFPHSQQAAGILKAAGFRADLTIPGFVIALRHATGVDLPALLERVSTVEVAAVAAAEKAAAAAELAAAAAEERRAAAAKEQELRRLSRIKTRVGRIKIGECVSSLFGDRVVESFGASWVDRETGWTYCYAYSRPATESEIAKRRAEPPRTRTGYSIALAATAPKVGQVWRDGGEVVVVTDVSRSWFVSTGGDDEVDSFYSSQFWEQYVVRVEWRAATAAEAETLAASAPAATEPATSLPGLSRLLNGECGPRSPYTE